MQTFLIAIPHDDNPEAFKILLPLGLILLFSKLFALGLHKIKIPQVIGYLLAGLLIGLIYFIPNQSILTDYTVTDGLSFFSKVAVVLIMFSAGIETDLKKVKSVGLASFCIALFGVLLPLILAFVVAHIFNTFTGSSLTPVDSEGNQLVAPIYSELFYGVILTATSVSITVATLKEFGKLDTKVGSALVSASIIDDIMGIIVLSLVISLSNGQESSNTLASLCFNALPESAQNAGMSIFFIILFMLIFFGLTFFAGFFLRKLFNYLGEKYPHHIRITILSLAFCLLWSYIAEYFNIADITGAYLMGLILSSTVAHGYIDHRAETTCNYLFAPVFFANIAMSMYQSSFNFSDQKFVFFFIFGLVWILLGIIGKILGSGSISLAFKFKLNDSLKIGIGMMARAEVLIVCAQKGVDNQLVKSEIMPFALLLILITSFLTPLLLRACYNHDEKLELKAENQNNL